MKFLYLLFLIPLLINCGSSSGTSPFTENGGAIGTGVVTQKGISIAANPLNPEALNFQTVEVSVTVTASDKNNFPVPNDTIINFRSETGGQIQPTCSITSTTGEDATPGRCSITWFSGGERPADGTVTILAYTEGSESYTDVNGNDLYDGPTVDIFDVANDDIPEAFVDANNNGTYDTGENFIDFNNNQIYDLGDGLYNGDDCVGDNTVCGNSTVNVFQNIAITLSGSQLTSVTSATPISIAVSTASAETLIVTDINGNSLPFDTTLDITITGATILPPSFTISAFGETQFPVIITTEAASGPQTITVTSTTSNEIVSSANLGFTIP